MDASIDNTGNVVNLKSSVIEPLVFSVDLVNKVATVDLIVNESMLEKLEQSHNIIGIAAFNTQACEESSSKIF